MPSFLTGRANLRWSRFGILDQQSILCDDIEGIDWVRLKEFQIFRGGTHKEVEIRKAEDIFASLEERDRSIPNGGRLSKASFQIKFSDSKTPRTVTLSSRQPSSVQAG